MLCIFQESKRAIIIYGSLSVLYEPDSTENKFILHIPAEGFSKSSEAKSRAHYP
jgi:hypothetical protein